MYNLSVDPEYSQKRKYDMARFMRYDEEDEFYDILDSEFINTLPYVRSSKTRTITFEEGSPSLVSELVYGLFNYQYYWLILELNNLLSPEDLVAGLNIRLPELSMLDAVFSQLNVRNN